MIHEGGGLINIGLIDAIESDRVCNTGTADCCNGRTGILVGVLVQRQ